LLISELLIDYDFLTIIALGCVIILALEDRGFVGAFLNSRPMEALGDWSYSIYLWHAPVHFASGARIRHAGRAGSQTGITNGRRSGR
jgi:peptidoglycan/LPS O-acetylase OafA/YrhL